MGKIEKMLGLQIRGWKGEGMSGNIQVFFDQFWLTGYEVSRILFYIFDIFNMYYIDVTGKNNFYYNGFFFFSFRKCFILLYEGLENIFFIFVLVLLRNNWRILLYKFKVYGMMV